MKEKGNKKKDDEKICYDGAHERDNLKVEF